jgi:phospholipid/cholesterol/gamma-HCH transport system substrate-binding protein
MSRFTSNLRLPGKNQQVSTGMAAFMVLAVLFTVLGLRPSIDSALSSGSEISAVFPDSYKLQQFKSLVKLNGLPVGSVSSISYDNRTAVIGLRLDDGVRELLGSAPTASIEPVNVLGGRYSVDLVPGGTRPHTFSGQIPLSRTRLPVELDSILGALPKTARQGVQGTLAKAAPTLADSRQSLKDSLVTLPQFLAPAGVALNAARGTRPGIDLPGLVTNLETTARVLTARDGQLEKISDDLSITADVLDRRTPELVSVLHDLPATVSSAQNGLDDLSVTLDKLRVASALLQPTAPRLERLVNELNPTLDIALPVMRDLKPILAQARPAVADLVPVAQTGTSVLDNLRGPVLDRLKGPVSDFILQPWNGGNTPGLQNLPGNYQRTHKFYEELAYMATNINRASMTQDSRGSTLAFQAGAGVESLTDGLPGAFPFSIEGIMELALQQQGITRPSVVKRLIAKAGVR